MKYNKKGITLVLVLLLMITAVVGGTFAYWQWITSAEQQTLVNVSLTDDATILIDFPDNELTNMYPTSDCEANGTSSWVTDITVNNGTGVKLATNFKLKIKIEDKDGNVITNGTNEWNAQPFRYYIKYAVTEENESCQNALIKGRFDSDVLTYANVANNDPHYSERNYWYDSPSITKKGTDGFPIVSSRIDSGVSFHALPNTETSHRYKVWVWLDKDYQSVTVGEDSSMDKLQDAKVTVSWSENSELEQIRESAVPEGEAIAIYSADDESFRFYREENPSSVTVGSTYNGRQVTKIYTGFENSGSVPWENFSEYVQDCYYDDEGNQTGCDSYWRNIPLKKIVFEDYIYPVSTANWFSFSLDYLVSNYQMLEIDVTKLDTSRVTNMSYMFNEIDGTIVGIENWDTSNVTDMSNMFDASNTKLNLSGWNVCNVTEYTDFAKYEYYEHIDSIVQPYFGVKAWCNGGNPAPNYEQDSRGEAVAIYSYDDQSLRFYRSTTPISLGSVYNGLKVDDLYTGFETENYDSYASVPWYSHMGAGAEFMIYNLVYEDYIYPISTAYWHGYNSYTVYTFLDVSKLNTSNVINMSYMFKNVSFDGEIIGLEEIDTSNVTNMDGMFENASFSNELDISSWNVCKISTRPHNFSSNNIIEPNWGMTCTE